MSSVIKSSPLKIGLTGGIGSGKTTVAKVFESLGIPIYYADACAKSLMEENEQLRSDIQKVFGEKVYKKGVLNRKYLAEIVFEDKKALEKLNALVHPRVRADFKNWAKKQGTPYVIEESAIIFEIAIEKDFDKIISVICPLEERMERILQRDCTTKKQVQARMAMQIGDKKRIEKSDYLLKNGKDELLLPQIIEIDNILRK